jgi:tetratricopeptide (TPR) repeat protein
MADPELPGPGPVATPDDDSKVVSRLADALESLRAPGRTDGALWRSAGGVLRTEWKYLLIGVMILVGHFKYHLSLLYYAHELAHAQEEHIVADNQREANGKILQHHVDLGNSLFGDGEMRGAESEFREALKLDGTNLEAERGLFKASIFNEVDDDTSERTASPVVILSRIRELACEVRETECISDATRSGDPSSRPERVASCATERWQCIKARQGKVIVSGLEGAHTRLLEGMAMANVDPKGSFEALNEAILLADGPTPAKAGAGGGATPQPTNLAAAYIRIGDYYLGQPDDGAPPKGQDGRLQHQDTRLQKAVAAYQTALRATPWNINAIDSMGYALHRLGRLEDARVEFQFLGDLDDTLMVAHADLARTLRCLGIRSPRDATALDDAYEEQFLLLSLLTSGAKATTRDTVSQWQYPVNGSVFDLHDRSVKVAYATCAMSLTGHLRGLPSQVEVCRHALTRGGLTSYQVETVREFLAIELDELLGMVPLDPTRARRARSFKKQLDRTSLEVRPIIDASTADHQAGATPAQRWERAAPSL